MMSITVFPHTNLCNVKKSQTITTQHHHMPQGKGHVTKLGGYVMHQWMSVIRLITGSELEYEKFPEHLQH